MISSFRLLLVCLGLVTLCFGAFWGCSSSTEPTPSGSDQFLIYTDASDNTYRYNIATKTKVFVAKNSYLKSSNSTGIAAVTEHLVGGGSVLYKVDKNGTVTEVLRRPDLIRYAEFTADGNSFVFSVFQDNGLNNNRALYMKDGSNEPKLIVPLMASETPAVISPDGKRIAYTIDHSTIFNGDDTLAVINIDGTNRKVLRTNLSVVGDGYANYYWLNNSEILFEDAPDEVYPSGKAFTINADSRVSTPLPLIGLGGMINTTDDNPNILYATTDASTVPYMQGAIRIVETPRTNTTINKIIATNSLNEYLIWPTYSQNKSYIAYVAAELSAPNYDIDKALAYRIYVKNLTTNAVDTINDTVLDAIYFQ
jgi:hypothetical protein